MSLPQGGYGSTTRCQPHHLHPHERSRVRQHRFPSNIPHRILIASITQLLTIYRQPDGSTRDECHPLFPLSCPNLRTVGDWHTITSSPFPQRATLLPTPFLASSRYTGNDAQLCLTRFRNDPARSRGLVYRPALGLRTHECRVSILLPEGLRLLIRRIDRTPWPHASVYHNLRPFRHLRAKVTRTGASETWARCSSDLWDLRSFVTWHR
jgi:hypothetical protein